MSRFVESGGKPGQGAEGMSIGSEKLEERLFEILRDVDYPEKGKGATEWAILLTLMEICRQLQGIRRGPDG